MRTALDLHGIDRSLDGRPVLEHVDLTVEAGTVHALVGLNGAGKTTLMRIALGMLRPDKGRASVLGRDPWGPQPPDWGRVGHLIEAPSGYAELTARENLWVAATLHGVPRRETGLRIDAALAAMALDPWADRRGRSLSAGTRQKVGLAAAMLHQPDLLVLDEPANTLDPLAVVRFRDLLRTATQRGCGVLLSSHHLDELTRWADQISVLNQGRIIGSLDPRAADLERAFFERVLADDAVRSRVPGQQVPS